jgi:hypothetical protein
MSAQTITVQVPLSIRRRPGRKTIVTPEGTSLSPHQVASRKADPAMVKALARAFRWKRMLDAGRYASVSEIATKEKIDRGYVGSILRLTLLAPDIIEAILNGQAAGLSLPRLLEPFPLGMGCTTDRPDSVTAAPPADPICRASSRRIPARRVPTKSVMQCFRSPAPKPASAPGRDVLRRRADVFCCRCRRSRY